MDIWLALLLIHVVCAGICAAGVLIAFFRKHPDGATDFDELQLLAFISIVVILSAVWELLLIGVLSAKRYVEWHNAKGRTTCVT